MASSFDAYKAIKELQTAGVPEAQAEVAVKVWRELWESQNAVLSEQALALSEQSAKINALETHIKNVSDTASQDLGKAEIRVESAMVRLENKVDLGFARVDAKMNEGFARADAKMNEGFAKADAKMNEGFARADAKMNEGFAKADGKFMMLQSMLGIIAAGIVSLIVKSFL